MSKEVVINNSKLNSQKFRVLTAGIDTEQYRRNPLLLWMHQRGANILPIGRVDNLRVEGDNLIGTPVFDETDDFAVKIKKKWDAGFLRMVSASLDPVEVSTDRSLMLEGQKLATVKRSKLIEVSIVDIGANDDAIVLYREGCPLDMSAPEMSINNQINNDESKMKTIALKLGLPEGASEAEILTKIGSLQQSAGSAVELQRKLDEERDRQIETEVENAVTSKRITADRKAHFVMLGKTSGLDALKTTLELLSPAAKPTDVINPGASGASVPETYKKLSDVPADKRIELRRDDPEAYKTLYKAEYGIECIIDN
jgi:hypothetical protein